MLLRSSSTPLLGSLLSSFSDSPNNNIHNHHEAANPKHQMFHHQSLNHKLPCLTTNVSCNSSPISPSLSESNKGIRRAQSEGNLEGYAYVSCNNNKNSNELEHFTSPGQSKKLNSGRQKCLMLETIPSFSLCNLRRCSEDDDEDDEEEDKKNGVIYEEESGVGWRSAMDNMVLNEEWRVLDRNWNNVVFEERNGGSDEHMYLAKGLGIGSGGGNNSNGSGGGGFNSAGGDGGDMNSTEEYYKKMVKENPGNPLFLRNYAHFLYQTKQDLQGAEEYYSRAILADPKDGEIVSQYAKLVWELHHDQDRASTYFERAVQAAPEDSHVHAAYASFLWETEEDEDECVVPREFDAVPSSLHGGAMASAGA